MIVMPGKYIPRFWWFPWIFKRLVGVRRFGRICEPDAERVAKLWKDITDEDCCQRGPDGRPEYTLTPFVQFLTKKEWDAIGRKLDWEEWFKAHCKTCQQCGGDDSDGPPPMCAKAFRKFKEYMQ